MTVQELIDKLMTMPKDALVIRSFCSDYDEVPEDDPTLITAEDRKIVIRQGRLMDYREKHWDKTEVPVFVTVVHFEGN